MDRAPEEVTMTAADHLNKLQFHDEVLPVSHLLPAANPAWDEIAAHRDRVDKLIDSMREHGYRPEMADDPIQLVRRKEGMAVTEGGHRVWAAHYAGLSHLPVRVADV
jgi:ParB-like nuclease family protein